MNPNKACGLDGLTPGVFRLLPESWLLLLATLFNCVFNSRHYPTSWSRAKLFTIFKKGSKSLSSNYRGITVMNSIAKLYDKILCTRLKQWFQPFREQAGAQENRSCIEHIMCLRLLCDMAKKKRVKLYVTFIDFSQAYDMVPRDTLFKVLQRLGCGSVMLAALIAMYSLTQSIIGTTVVTIALGVHQG